MKQRCAVVCNLVGSSSLDMEALQAEKSNAAGVNNDVSPAILRRGEATPGLIVYEVGDRDTIPKIAVRFNTSASFILQINKLSSQVVFPGQTILVPDPNRKSPLRSSSPFADAASSTSSGISCCASATTSSAHSVGEVTSAYSTATNSDASPSASWAVLPNQISTRDRGYTVPERPMPSGPGGVSASGTVTMRESQDDDLVIVDSHFSPVGTRRRQSAAAVPLKSSASVSKSSALPSNSEPLPLEIITDSLLAVDAQCVNLEEGIARGTLRVTKDRINFDPWGADRLVRVKGPECFTCSVPWSGVSSLAMYPNLVKMSVHDPPLTMSQKANSSVEFLFVSHADWSRLAPRAHVSKHLPDVPRSASGDTSPALSGSSASPATVKASSSTSSGGSSGGSNAGTGVARVLSGTKASPVALIRASFTPPTSRTNSNASHNGASPAASPARASSSASSNSSQSESRRRGSVKRMNIFRTRSSTGDLEEASRLAALPGYLCVRTQPLSQDQSCPEKELIFAIPGAKKAQLFDFLSHNLPKIQNINSTVLALFYANLKENANANCSSSSSEALSLDVATETDGNRLGKVLRIVSPGSDESPEHKHRPACQRSTSLGKEATLDDSWDVLETSEDLATQTSTASGDGPSLQRPSKILSSEQLINLSKELPLQVLDHTWKLAYSTYVHGISLQTLYRNCRSTDGPVLLVVRDAQQHVFGVLSSCSLHVCDTFLGNGTSFLYTFHQDSTCSVFHWSGDNSFFFKGDRDSMSFGGGRGKFGLWLDADFYHGASHPCTTFNNTVLSHATDFICSGVEAYIFD